MRRLGRIFPLAVALIPAVAVAAGAQERPRVEVREPQRGFVYRFGPDDMRVDMRRGRIGIVVSLAPDAARDSIGALVQSVTPGGPADRAGLQANDIITRMNGVTLGVTNAADRDQDESRPGRRLINLASRLDPGDTVRLDVRRGSRTQTYTLEAGESDLDMIVERMREPGGIVGRLPHQLESPRMNVQIFPFGSVSDLELVTVSPELARGLGVSEGLLVVSVGSDSSLNLQAGDVITAIGGRRPTSPAHAMRILSTYEPSEQIQFEIMRQRRRTTVSGQLPASQMRWRSFPNSFRFGPGTSSFHFEAPDLEFQFPDMDDRLHELRERMDGLRHRIETDAPGPVRMRIKT